MDTTGTGIPKANNGDSDAAAEEEQVQPEPMNQAQAVPPSEPARRRLRRPWPYGSGLPGFRAYRIPERDSSSAEHEERTEHDDPMQPEPTSDSKGKPTPITRISKRCREPHPGESNQTEVESDDEPAELHKDGESSDSDQEYQTPGKMSSDPKSCKSP